MSSLYSNTHDKYIVNYKTAIQIKVINTRFNILYVSEKDCLQWIIYYSYNLACTHRILH